MKALILVILSISITACSKPSGSPAPVVTPVTPIVVATPTPVPTPVPTPTPTPVPVTYDCTTHPASNKAYANDAGLYNIAFHDDCTYEFSDNDHISYGIWTPDPNPDNITQTSNTKTFPMNLHPTGAYVCLPANGPQNCSNYGWAGDVLIQVSKMTEGTGLIISQ